MTNEYSGLVCEVRKPRADVRATAKYALSQRSCRKLLTFGGLLGAAALALPYLVGMLLISFLPQAYLSDGFSLYFTSAIILLTTLAGVPFIFSPVYFGMYRVLLKASFGKELEGSDLFVAFRGKREYLRSIGVFFQGFGIIYGAYAVLWISQIVGIFTEIIPIEYIDVLLWLLAEAVMFIYILFGIVYSTLMRKHNFLLIPMMVHRTDLSVSQCKKLVYAAKREVYTSQLQFDLPKCLLWNLLSLFTIGILQIVFVGPDMISKKTALYRESVIWLNDDFNDEI